MCIYYVGLIGYMDIGRIGICEMVDSANRFGAVFDFVSC